MTRTDVHSPSNLVTEDYDFLASFDLNSEYPQSRMEFWREMNAKGYRRANVHPLAQCDHCGAHLRYVAYLLHLPTKTIVEVGETCLGNRFSRATEAFRQLKRQAELDRAKQSIKTARAAYAEANPDVVAHLESNPSNSDFLADLLGKLNRYGYLTERQTDAVRSNIARDIKRAEERAEREANASPVPEGKQTVTGKVISTKVVDTPYGPTDKMLVEDDRGFRIFGTIPSAIMDVPMKDNIPLPGRRVSFSATLEQSKDDATFGFYKRPTKAEVL